MQSQQMHWLVELHGIDMLFPSGETFQRDNSAAVIYNQIFIANTSEDVSPGIVFLRDIDWCSWPSCIHCRFSPSVGDISTISTLALFQVLLQVMRVVISLSVRKR